MFPEKSPPAFAPKKLAASIALCLLAGFVGSFFTSPEITGWYAALNKPSFSPPNWIFFPVWTTLYIMMGTALYLVWNSGAPEKKVKAATSIFAIQLVLNILWSVIFFGMRSPPYAFAEIIALWAAIALAIKYFWRVSRAAGMLLLPYILWVSFAAILNYSIVALNP